MPVKDSLSAEISLLSNKIEDIENQLREERKNNESLRVESEKKIQLIKRLEDNIEKERKVFQKNKEQLYFNRQLIEKTANEKLEELKEKEIFYQVELSRYDLLDQENQKLQEQFKELSMKYTKLKEIQDEEYQSRTNNALNLKIAMDQVLRKTITAMDKEYEKREFEKLKHDTLIAAKEINKFNESYDHREKSCIDRIRIQQKSYDELVKEKVTLDVVKATTALQEQMLIEFLTIIKSELKDVEEAYNKLQHNYESTKLIFKNCEFKSYLQSHLNDINTQISDYNNKIESLKKSINSMTSQLFSYGIKIDKYVFNQLKDQNFSKFEKSILGEVNNKLDSKIDNELDSKIDSKLEISIDSTIQNELSINSVQFSDKKLNSSKSAVDRNTAIWQNQSDSYSHLSTSLRKLVQSNRISKRNKVDDLETEKLLSSLQMSSFSMIR